MELFDFERSLRLVDPEQFYSINLVTTGNCNVVARATKRGDTGKYCFPYTSLILKHVKSYFLKRGQDCPLSLGRQVRDVI